MTAEQTTQEELFYLVDSRSKVGTNSLFWADAGGYTTSIELAEKFPKSRALRQYRSRDSDIPVPVSFLEGCKRQRVDMQVLPSAAGAETAPDEPCVLIKSGKYDGNDCYFDGKTRDTPEFNKAQIFKYKVAAALVSDASHQGYTIYRHSDLLQKMRHTIAFGNVIKKALLLAGFDYLITPQPVLSEE